jgi:hypothetical protein
MEEIEAAMLELESQTPSDGTNETESSSAVPAAPTELHGITAVASEVGTIEASVAGTEARKAVEGISEMEIVESKITIAEKGGLQQLTFKYGRNSAPELERSVRDAQFLARSVDVQRPTSVIVDSTPTNKSTGNDRRSVAETMSVETHEPTTKAAKDPPASEDKNAVTTPKTPSRHRRYYRNSISSIEAVKGSVATLAIPHIPQLPDQPNGSPSRGEQDRTMRSSLTPRTPAYPTYLDIQTKSNPELAAQLIARALRVDFVYFMRLTPITAKSPNLTGDAEVNLELLGCHGLPFPSMQFSPFTHLEALRSELGMIYYSGSPDSSDDDTDDSYSNAKDHYKVGIVVPVWREYSRNSFIQPKLTRSRSSADGKRSSRESSATTSMTISTLRENCRKGVVVGAFSKCGERNTFTKAEREYLKEWVSLREHL